MSGQRAAAAGERTCPSCGAAVLAGDNFCESCSAPLGTPCTQCQSGLVGADGYCQACGAKAPAARDHVEQTAGTAAGVSDRGLRHFRNEDAMALAVAGGQVVAVVCDGVSSTEHPDEASQAAAQAALAVLVSAAGGDPGEALLAAVAAAGQAVAAVGDSDSADAPSATYVSAVVTGAQVTVCWLGDSRAYWLDEAGGSQRLSTDDSVASELVASGALTDTQAMKVPQAHVVTGWLGADGSQAQPHVAAFTPPGPGVVMLCTDGLWNYEHRAGDLAARALPGALADPLATARSLTDFAIASGGHDNITVVLIPFPPKEKHDG